MRGGRILTSIHMRNMHEIIRPKDIFKRLDGKDNRSPERSLNDKTVMQILWLCRAFPLPCYTAHHIAATSQTVRKENV